MDEAEWIISETIRCQHVTASYLEQTVDFVNKYFFTYENISKTIKLAEDAEALKELSDLTRAAAKDGLCLIAIDTLTNKIAGIAINKVQTKDSTEFEKFFETWQNKNSKAVVKFMAEFDSLCNIFDHCNVDCILELMYLGTSPEYAGYGIGTKLTALTIKLCQNLNRGVNVKRGLHGEDLPLEPVPKAISSIFTTIATQRIGEKFGFVRVASKDYAGLDFQHGDFSEVVKSGTESVTLEYLKI